MGLNKISTNSNQLVEILANNPGVFRGTDGKYYLPNKWSPNEPYLIVPSKEQMIMLYGGDDMAVCDGAIFKGSYVDQAAFKANGQLNYQDPTNLQYGQIVDVTKQAPGAFKLMPEGTQMLNQLNYYKTAQSLKNNLASFDKVSASKKADFKPNQTKVPQKISAAPLFDHYNYNSERSISLVVVNLTISPS